MTARFMSATAATIAFRCSTRIVLSWVRRVAIPTGEAGKCGYVAERFVSDHTNIIGTAVSATNFSTDKAQSCLYVADNANMAIYILNRSNLQELGRFGHSGRAPGECPLDTSSEPG